MQPEFFEQCNKTCPDKIESPCASDAFQQECHQIPGTMHPSSMDTTVPWLEPPGEFPVRTTADRANELIPLFNNPPRDQGLFFNHIVRTFCEEQRVNGVNGMECLTDKINKDSCAGLVLDRFRNGKVYALYFNYAGRDVELPIVGR